MTPSAFDTETVDRAIKEASAFLWRNIEPWFVKAVGGSGPVIARSESPIEAVFWVWWQALDAVYWLRVESRMPFELVPQHEVVADGVHYRLDFAVPKHKIAIEMDGHNFHERTREQVTQRNERDRRLQSDGWQVLHYSGTELLQSPAQVVRDVYGRCLRAEGIGLS